MRKKINCGFVIRVTNNAVILSEAAQGAAKSKDLRIGMRNAVPCAYGAGNVSTDQTAKILRLRASHYAQDDNTSNWYHNDKELFAALNTQKDVGLSPQKRYRAEGTGDDFCRTEHA